MSKTYNIQAPIKVYFMSPRQQKFSFLSHRLISLVKALYYNLLPECTKMRILRCTFAKSSRQHAPGDPRMVVPSALSLKLIGDVTRLWRNFAHPSESFCVRQSVGLCEGSSFYYGKWFLASVCWCVIMKIFRSPCCIQIPSRPVSCTEGWVAGECSCCAIKKNVIVTSQLYDAADVGYSSQ